MSRGKRFSISLPPGLDPAVSDVIRRLQDELNRLNDRLEAGDAPGSRLVSDRAKIRVQTTDKGTHQLEVDTPDGPKKIDLSDLE